MERERVDPGEFNDNAYLPYNLRIEDFSIGMQDVYDFFFDVNQILVGKGLERFDDLLRPAAMSGIISDMLTASMGRHARSLVPNRYFNGHPDLVVKGRYPNDSVRAGEEGVEIKSTRKRGGAVDLHGARKQCLCIFVYEVDSITQPTMNRRPMRFREVYLQDVELDHFRRNPRGELGTRTATLDRVGVAHLRKNWIYRAG